MKWSKCYCIRRGEINSLLLHRSQSVVLSLILTMHWAFLSTIILDATGTLQWIESLYSEYIIQLRFTYPFSPFQFMPDNILNCIPCVPCQTNIIQTVQCDCIQDQDTLWSWFILSCTWDVSLHYPCPVITSNNLRLSKLSQMLCDFWKLFSNV